MKSKIIQMRVAFPFEVEARFSRFLVVSLALALITFLSMSCGSSGVPESERSDANVAGNKVGTAGKNTDSASSDKSSDEPDGTDHFAHIKREHREVLRKWLRSKPHLRPAVEELDNWMFHEKGYENKEKFKEQFEDNVRMIREAVGTRGYQYYSVGDMNQDGQTDFAVLLVNKSNRDTDEFDDFALAIFNAPFKTGQPPAYFEEGLSGVTNSYIVYDIAVKKHLYLGKFESDVYCATYYAKGETYYFRDCLDE